MNYIGIVETSYDMADGIDLSDVRKEFIAKALALARTLDESCDINEFYYRGSILLGIIHLSELIESLVGNGYDTYIGLDGAEGVVGRFGTCLCDRIEKCALSYVRKSYYA